MAKREAPKIEILEILANTKLRHWGTWILSLVVSMGRILLPSGES